MENAITSKESIYLPEHIAIIMDGNGRWAKERRLSRLKGHEAGVDNIRKIVERVNECEIRYLTLYGFSTENWSRPHKEVDGLFRLLEERIDNEALELHRNNVRIRHLGRLDELPESTQVSINRAIELTRDNQGLTLSLAFNYGGRIEILDAVRCAISRGLSASEINEDVFNGLLYTTGLPGVDLIIRTGGELRLSNFLIWQTANSNCYFTKIPWPEFDNEELNKALLFYSQRKM
ncbi:polyprenyl diphosphate synthase [Chloroflexota bacterium]